MGIGEAAQLATTAGADAESAEVAGGAAAAAGGGGIMATFIPLLPAIIAAVAAYWALNQSHIAGQNQSVWQSGTEAAGKGLAMFAGGLGTIEGFISGHPDMGSQWFKTVAVGLGLMSDNAKKATEALGPTDDQLKAYVNYIKSEATAEETYQKDRLKLVQDYTKQDLAAEKTYQENQDKEIRDFNQSETQAEQTELEFKS